MQVLATKNHSLQAYEEKLQGLGKPSEILLINPMQVPKSVFDVTVARKCGYFNYPPMGLVYIAAVAQQVAPDIDVKILDLNHETLKQAQDDGFSYDHWKKSVSDLIATCKNPLIGISCMFSVNAEMAIDIAQYMRQNFPDLPLIGGGVQATYDYDKMLEEWGFDIVFRKESEIQFSLFLKNLLHQDLTDTPSGVVFSHKDKTHSLGEPIGDVPVHTNINDHYSLLEIEEYHKYGALAVFSRYNGKEKPYATVLTNRGCRAYCTFCTVRDFNGKGVRAREVEDVIDELKLLWTKGIRQIDWLDDDFLWDKERVLLLMKRMTEEVPDMEWISNNGLIAAAINEEIMEWMVRSGLKALKVGIESGNDKMLKSIKKPTSKRKLLAVSRLFQNYPEVFYSGNFIVGFPNETFAEMMDSYLFAKQLNWDWASFYVCQPLKGTEMYSVFRDVQDDRVSEDRPGKAINPGRLATRGEFGVKNTEKVSPIYRGRDIFNIPMDSIPGMDQLNEIWFTFNLDVNFINNPNFQPGSNINKIIRWFDSIHSGYPHDASMIAGLVKAYKMAGDQQQAIIYQKKFKAILDQSSYWTRRVDEFPEILSMAGL